MATRNRPRLRLRHILFLALLLAGIIPMLVSSVLLVGQNRELLEEQERDMLVTEAQAHSQELSQRLVGLRKQLSQLASVLAFAPALDVGVEGGADGQAAGGPAGGEHLGDLLRSFLEANAGDVLAVATFDDRRDPGTAYGVDLEPVAYQELRAGAMRVLDAGRAVYEFGVLPEDRPVAVVAVPVPARGEVGEGAAGEAGEAGRVVAALVRPAAFGAFLRGGQDDVGTALLGEQGQVLWAQGIPEGQWRSLSTSQPVSSYVLRPFSLLSQYPVEVDGELREMLIQIAPIDETGWAVAAQRPLSAAFRAADQLVFNTLASALIVVLLALVLAAVAARRVSEPVQELAATSHEIAAGNFGQRVEISGLTVELSELAEDFNRMSGHVERYVEELKRAVQANRELFIGSLRAFAAAIDAKDPYTRGHSERVATLSRTICRHLGLSGDMQHKVWIAALLHDVGKIGVEDRILKKSGVLTDDEFNQMKLHTVIGAEILSPIVDLRDMVPAVRWHHENWNGRGYPDGLKGEQIPLMARIVAVADTFDAVTTNRPYQEAYSLEDAVATIRRLVGSRFDAKIVTAFLRAYEHGEVRLPKRPGPRVEPAVSAGIGA